MTTERLIEAITTPATPTLTIELALFGETRTCDLHAYACGDGMRGYVFGLVGTIGQGVARYPSTLILSRFSEPGDRPLYRGNKTATASDGTKWQFHLSTTIRNRSNARFVGWTSTVGATNYENQVRS